MYYMTEQNERRTRRHAFILAILLHFALAAGLFLSMSEQPTAKTSEKSVQVKEKINAPGPKGKLLSSP
jgi:membrane protein involved in colicin uptake